MLQSTLSQVLYLITMLSFSIAILLYTCTPLHSILLKIVFESIVKDLFCGSQMFGLMTTYKRGKDALSCF